MTILKNLIMLLTLKNITSFNNKRLTIDLDDSRNTAITKINNVITLKIYAH